MNATRSQLAKQLASVKSYLPVIEAAGEPYGFSASLLLAIGSRETNFAPKYKEFPGDHGFGHSWWQIDKRSYPEFVASGDWKDVEKAVQKSAQVLDEKRNELIDLTVKDNITPETLLRMAIAGYNCGSGNAYRNWLKHGDPDRGTTGHDYSADVLEREEVFKDLLEAEKAPSTVVTTVSTKVESSEPAKTQPPPQEITPATATVVTSSQPSLFSRITSLSLPAWMIAALTGIAKFIITLPPWAWALMFTVSVLAAVYLYNESQKRALARTLKAADMAGAQDKNNVYFGGAQ